VAVMTSQVRHPRPARPRSMITRPPTAAARRTARWLEVEDAACEEEQHRPREARTSAAGGERREPGDQREGRDERRPLERDLDQVLPAGDEHQRLARRDRRVHAAAEDESREQQPPAMKHRDEEERQDELPPRQGVGPLRDRVREEGHRDDEKEPCRDAADGSGREERSTAPPRVLEAPDREPAERHEEPRLDAPRDDEEEAPSRRGEGVDRRESPVALVSCREGIEQVALRRRGEAHADEGPGRVAWRPPRRDATGAGSGARACGAGATTSRRGIGDRVDSMADDFTEIPS